MKKTGKNNRILASILAASMLLTMSPFAFAADEAEETTTQEQVQSTEVNEAVDTFESDIAVQDDTTVEEGTTTPEENPEEPGTPENAAKIGKTKYASIGDAIAAASSEDTIVLLRDVTENITINKSLTLDLGGFMLSGDGTKTVVSISGKDVANVTIKNGTITGGNASKGGGFSIDRGTVVIDNCIIENNKAQSGGGIYMIGPAKVKIIGSEIRSNSAPGAIGGAIHAASDSAGDSVCEVVNTKLDNNTAYRDGAVGVGANLFNKGITTTFIMDG